MKRIFIARKRQAGWWWRSIWIFIVFLSSFGVCIGVRRLRRCGPVRCVSIHVRRLGLFAWCTVPMGKIVGYWTTWASPPSCLLPCPTLFNPTRPPMSLTDDVLLYSSELNRCYLVVYFINEHIMHRHWCSNSSTPCHCGWKVRLLPTWTHAMPPLPHMRYGHSSLFMKVKWWMSMELYRVINFTHDTHWR